nr:MAG TPA: tail tape measure [Bacteriophage sp.]
MANSSLGAALTIPKSALDAIEQADKKLKDIQDTAKHTASGVTQSFKDMSIGTKPFLDSLDQVIAKLATINASAANASNGISNVGASAGNMNNNITSAAQNIQNMVAQLSKMNGSGTSGIMQAALAFQRLQESAKGASGMNIAELKQEIGGIESMLRDTSNNLTKADQDALIKRKKSLQDELKYQQQMYNERVVAFQKALDRMVSAEQSYNNKQRKLYADRAKNYQNKNYKSNTTYQGALDFSATANTLNRQVRAIEYLKEARMKLSQTDADYKRKLDILNAAIEQHNKNLKEAGVNSRALTEQTSYMAGYMSRWAQRMAFAFSVGSIKNFVEQIASVRGQFELSERSLEAILQNKSKADEIFNKTVELAVKSPFRIKDLVDYTRQLSAYRIESDKLYDTTKRLADVSAGLGVDMGRLILAYGQVKAAAYLRGSEVRQFTEAGVNMYGELQEYFKDVKGEAYTTAQIVDMISKRMVKFEDVEAVFQRMTDKGGMFYNMQEVQANTLYGMIQKMHDAFDVMLNDIGKANQDTFKGSIQFATDMLKHWEAISNAGKALLSVIIAIKVHSILMRTSLAKSIVIDQAMVGKWQAFLNIFRTMPTTISQGFTKAKNAIVAASGAIKAALGGIALYAVIQTVLNYRDALNECEKAINKSHETTVKTLGKISELSIKYKELSENVTGAANAQNASNSSNAKTIDEKRKALQKLIEYANQEGLNIKLNIDTLNETQLDEQFKIIEKKYRDFAFELDAIMERAAQSDKKGWWWGISGITEGLQEYKTASIDIISQTNKVEQAMALVTSNYKDANKYTKQYFDTLRNGRNEGEEDIDYLVRMNNAWKNLEAYYSKNSMVLPKWLVEGQSYMKDLSGSFKDLDSAIAQTKENFKDVFVGKGGVDEFKKKYQNDPLKLKAEIDQYAAEKSLSDTEKRLLYWVASHEYKIKFQADEKSVENTIDYVDKTIQSFIDGKHYKIKIDADNLSDPLKKWSDYFDNLEKEQKSLKETEEWMNRIIAKGKGRKKGLFVFDQSEFKDDELALMGIRKKPKINFAQWGKEQGNEISVTAEQLKKLAQAKLGAVGDVFNEWNWETKEDKKNARKNKNAADKAQRDILNERISLLKDMNSKYNELIKTESKETALSATRKYFKEAAQNVGWKASDILPDDASVAKRIRGIGSQCNELTKRGNAFRISADIDLKVSEKEYNKLKDDISRNVNDAFSQVELYKKLKDEGMSDELIKSMFGDITETFNEVQEDINNEFNKYIIKDYETHYGKDFTKWGDNVIQQYNSDLENTADVIKKKFAGSDVEKEYLSQTQKLNQKIEQDTTDTAQKLFKEYKQRLSDQLQLDRKYIADRIAIMKNFSDPETQKKLLDNIDLDYKKKTGENTWKDFKNSDMYVRLFDNLDQVSSKALDAMAERLQQLRTELRDLDPTELKTIAEQINKVNEVRNSRNPFKAFSSGLKEMIKAGKDLKKSGGVDKYVELNGLKADLTSKLQSQNAYVESLEQEYNELTKINGADENVVAALKLKLTTNKSIRDSLKSQLNLTDEQIAKLGTIMTEEEQAKAKFSKSVTDITSVVSTMATAFNGLFEALGGSDEQLENTLSVVDNIGQAIGSYYSGNYAGVAAGAMGALTGIAKLFSNEGKIDKEIARQERAINSLQHAYEKLKKSMDDAFDTQRLYEYNQKSVDALKKEQKAYQAMINAERGRKKPDEGKIQEWEQQIDDLSTTIQELGESMTEALGGFGSQSNYKSAAEAFSEAWVDAFNEGSDALEALNNKFDEYFNTMLTKQLMNRATSKYIQPILEAFDKAVSEGSEGGNNGLDVTKKELEGIKELKDKNLALFNEYAKNLMDVLNVKPTGSSNISALQQGIQSVTESTAQALESILNSLRYYVATQQADVRIIRDTLLEKLGNSISAITQDTSSSPVLIELRLQTTILTDIRDTLASCVKGGHKQGRNGIKVFMN